MSASHVRERALAASLLGFAIALTGAPAAFADPLPPPAPIPGPAEPPPASIAQADAPLPGLPGLPGLPADAPADGRAAAVVACKQFSTAMNYAAIHYEDFADSIAGNGAYVNYGDPNIDDNNVRGRTALRQAASVAMDAASTPGLSPDIATPMRSWSMNAAKLLVMMGVRANGDAIDAAATDVNSDSRTVQFACAAAGTRA
ncbi:MAG: hypothetical protein QOD10_3607 [Mycobacterium sp.]|jgi:hypothetical protein|nr:hypothetical protein [Mycobacterium sp.]